MSAAKLMQKVSDYTKTLTIQQDNAKSELKKIEEATGNPVSKSIKQLMFSMKITELQNIIDFCEIITKTQTELDAEINANNEAIEQVLKQGCLDGKTDEMKKEFFLDLIKFYNSDKEFFTTQFNDLKAHEKLELVEFLFNNPILPASSDSHTTMFEQSKHIFKTVTIDVKLYTTTQNENLYERYEAAIIMLSIHLLKMRIGEWGGRESSFLPETNFEFNKINYFYVLADSSKDAADLFNRVIANFNLTDFVKIEFGEPKDDLETSNRIRSAYQLNWYWYSDKNYTNGCLLANKDELNKEPEDE